MATGRIRIGLIGLSKSAGTSWASSAHLPYLLSSRGKARYELAALCNSTVESARNAVEAFGLPSTTKTYGDPTQLAADPDIDLVVCSVRVDRHHETIRPSLEAGKSVFCEWPLAANLDDISDLTGLAQSKGIKTVIGTQGRLSPAVVKLREILEQEKYGKLLSSEVRASGGTVDRLVLSNAIEYFTQRKVGGNMFIIGGGHLLDSVQYVTGDLDNIKSTVQLQRPNVPLKDGKTGEITKTVKSDVPDLIIATGTVDKAAFAQKGAAFSFRFRRGQPFPGEDPLVWTLTCEKGEIRLRSPGGTSINANAFSEPIIIEVHDYATDKVDQIEWDWEDWQKELPNVGRNTAAQYESFASGNPYPTFEDALKRHEQLEHILAGWSAPN